MNAGRTATLLNHKPTNFRILKGIKVVSVVQRRDEKFSSGSEFRKLFQEFLAGRGGGGQG